MKLYYSLTCVVLPAVMMVACSTSGSKKPSTIAVAAAATELQQPIQHDTKKLVKTLAYKINAAEKDMDNMEIPENEKFPLSQLAENAETVKPIKRLYQFGFDQQEISSDDQKNLQAHADYLIENSDAMLSIDGHSDTQGHPSYNVFLSKERAKKIAQFLIEYGAPESQIKIAGRGDSEPLNDINNFRENRRVELHYSDARVAKK